MSALAFMLAVAALPSGASFDNERSALEVRCTDEHGEDNLPEIRKCMGIVDASNMPLDVLGREINGRHPFEYFTLANRLFSEAGRKDDGVFWFYMWQLRHRILIACYPEADPSEEPAMFGAMFATATIDFNAHARANRKEWASIIDRVLRWDEANPDRFDPVRDCSAARDEQREGLKALAGEIRENQTALPAQSADQGE